MRPPSIRATPTGKADSISASSAGGGAVSGSMRGVFGSVCVRSRSTGRNGGWPIAPAAASTNWRTGGQARCRGFAVATPSPAPVVLVVDDDPDILEALSEILEVEGFAI